MASKKRPSEPQDDNIYRVKHISRAAWEEGSVPLPGLTPQPPAKPPSAQSSELSGNGALDSLDDSIVEMAMTQEISLDLIREYLRKEEEQARQRQQERSKQRAKTAPPVGLGPIRPDEIEGFQASDSKKPAPRAPKKQQKPARQQPRVLRPKPEAAKEPAPTLGEIEAAKEEMRAAKAKSRLPDPVTPPKKLSKPSKQKEPEKKAAAVKLAKPPKLQRQKPDKLKKPPKQQQPKPEKPSHSAKDRTGPIVWGLNTLRLFFYTDEDRQDADFWEDEIPLYAVPLEDIAIFCYRNLYYLGLRFARPMLLFFRYALPYLLHPILALWHLARAVALALHHVTIGRIRRRLAAGQQAHAKRLAARPPGSVGIIEAASGLVQDYRTMLSSIGNAVLPITALLVLLLVVRGVSNQTYALQVDYNHAVLGYISSESVYLSAQSAANQQISPVSQTDPTEPPSAENTLNTYAQFRMVRVGPEQLTSSDRLCDEMLSHAEDPVTSACGIYIAEEDGSNRHLVAATKNSTDAMLVLDNIKKAQSQGMKIQKAASVGFVQQVDLVQGFYPAAQLRDVQELQQALGGNVTGRNTIVVQIGDTLWDLAHKYDISLSRLLDMNPEIRADQKQFKPGVDLIIAREVPLLQLKVIQTERHIEPIAFEVISKDSATLYRGMVRIKVKGVPGEREVYERVTYINNIRHGQAEFISDRVIREPINEQREIGQKSTLVVTPSGPIRINPSAMGFTWPVPACPSISSYYGYRRSGFHKGVDILGGSAYGKTVVAAKDGVISWVGYQSNGYGYNVVINHGNGVQTRYAHMITNSCHLRSGQSVSIGQPIGQIGMTGNTTGPHLHFEVIINGRTQNPLNYIHR